MGKMKKTGALALLICLLALQVAAGALSTLRSDDPVPDSAQTTEQTQDLAVEMQTPASVSPGVTIPQIAPSTDPATIADDDPFETTEEIQLGGYKGQHTASADDLTEEIPSAAETPDPAVPEIDADVTDAPATDAAVVPTVTDAPVTDAPVTAPIVTEAPVTEAPATEPVVTKPVVTEPADTTPTEAPAAAPVASEGQGGLYDIADPDPKYTYKVVKVTGADRDLLERLVMGEAGDQGYIGAAMVAQCIKDAMTYQGYKTVAAVRSGLKYSGSISKKPNSDVIKAVAYIFDEGGYAVQHPMLYFYFSRNGIKKGFHETQEFVVQYKDHRFFWKKK